MAIVDFEQDPSAPFGSGNFRDESGRITYLHDPETASDFVTTMSGSIAASRGGGGAPDARLAMNDTGLPVGAGDPSMPTPPAPAPATASDAPNMSVDPGAKPTPEQLVTALGNATGPAPTAKAPGAPKSGPSKYLDALDNATRKPSREPLPPISGVTTNNSRTVVRGRASAPVDRQVAELDKYGAANDELKLQAGRDKDATTEKMFDLQGQGIDARRTRDSAKIEEAQAVRKKAQAEKALVEAALKKNDESLDPDRYIRTMTTGKQVGMAILAALNGAFGALIGQKENGVVAVLHRSIDADIDRQKQEIASGRIRMGNTIKELMDEGHDAKTAEMLARDRLGEAVDQKFELEIKRLGVTGEGERQAQLLVGQQREERAGKRGELLAQKEDRIQEASSRVEQREQPKGDGSGGVEGLLKMAQYESAMMKLRNDKIAVADANELSAEIYGVNDKGQPNKLLNPDQVKEIKDKANHVGPALAETAGAVNMTKVLIEALGGKLDETTGKLTKPDDGDLLGAGPVDKAGGYLGILPPTAPFVQAGRALNLYRADVDKARDAQAALKQFVTKQMTGANSSLGQDKTFGSMVGADFSNQDQTWENIQHWTDTLFAAQNQHMAGLGEAGMIYQRQLQAQAKAGNKAEPLKPRVTTGAVGTTVVPEEQNMSMAP